jgi:hypothetical protein
VRTTQLNTIDTPHAHPRIHDADARPYALTCTPITVAHAHSKPGPRAGAGTNRTNNVRMYAGDHFNKVADHLSHDRPQLAAQCALSELGVTLRRLPSHPAR